MRKVQIILTVMIFGLLLFLSVLGLAQPAAAQGSTRAPTLTKTPSPTPLGGIDTQTKAKIIRDINTNLTQGENNFAYVKFDDSKTAFQTALDSIQKYQVNDAFTNDADKAQMLGFEFRALSGLGRDEFGKIVAPRSPVDQGYDPYELKATDSGLAYDVTDDNFKAMEDYFTQALDVAKSLPDKLNGKGWLYWTWGQTEITRGTALLPNHQYNNINFYAVIRTDGFKKYMFLAQQLFGKAAAAFELTGQNYMASNSYFYLGSTAWILQGSDYQGTTANGWYKVVDQAYKDNQRTGGFGNYTGYDFFCQSDLEYIQRLSNGSTTDDSVKIEDLIKALRDKGPACGDANEWRGVGNSLLAWRSEDKVLAQSAINDLRPAITSFTGQTGWIGGQIFSNFVTLVAYDTHYLGRMYSLIGNQPDLALFYLQEADTAFSRTDTPPDLGPPIGIEWVGTEAQYQNIRLIGDNLTLLGRPREAIDQYKRVEAIKDYATNPIYPDVQLGLSNAYVALGQYSDAIDPLNNRRVFYENEVKSEQAKSTPDADLIKRDQGKLIDVQIRLSTPLAVLGRTEEALTGLQAALDQATAINDQTLLVDTNLRVGDIYLQLDSEDNAIAAYTKAATLADKPKLPLEQGQALLGLGKLQIKRALYKDAKDSLTKANQSASQAHDYATEVRVLKALGDLALTGDKPSPAQAQSSYSQALSIAQFTAKDPRLSIEILSAQGDLTSQSDVNAASVIYYRALATAHQIGDREDQATMYANIAKIDAAGGQNAEALQAYANAIIVIEATQRGFQSESLTSQFAAKYAFVYADYLKLLISQKQYNLAFEVAERARARAFLDQLAVGPVDLRQGTSADLLQQDNALRQNIDAVNGLLIQAQSANPPDKERISRLRQQLDKAQNDYATLFTRMQATDPQLTTLTTVSVAPLAQIQAALDADTTLLSYYTTDTGTYAFIATKTDFQVVQLDVKQPDLATAIANFRADEKAAAGISDLAKALVTPLLDKLTTKRLIIVPHNVLNYLPFAALPLDTTTLMGDKFAISYVPSANTLLHLPDKPAQTGALLALGNPIAEGFKPLPFAEDEVKGVNAIVKGQSFFEADAKESVVLNQSSDAGILYLAAHGTFNPINPLFSALHLSQGDGQTGLLEAYKIYQLDLTKKTELVVLSACETAVGKLSAGDEFSGLNRAFLYAGAPDVLASLWSVDDKATAMLMQAFFQARVDGKSNSEALQTAQATVRNYKDSDGKTPYTSPYYWAAFILTGRG